MEKKEIRQLRADELIEALDLVWTVFSEFEAPSCSDEGIEEFWSYIDYEYMLHRVGEGMIRFWGAFENGGMVGVCAIRDLSQIVLLYVNGNHHRRKIGSLLLKKAMLDCKEIDSHISRVTVDASQYALPFFLAMGFVPIGELQEQNGIVFTPMEVIGK